MSAPMSAMPGAMTRRPICRSSRVPFAGTGASWNSLGGPYETIGADGSGAIGGVEAGCDYEMPLGSLSLVVGGAADISVLNVSGEATSALFPDTNVSFNADWAATMRARLGVATPKVLVYATGGYAAAGLDVRAFDLSTAPGIGLMDVSGGGTESGWVIGGGAEWRMTPSCSLSFEYLRFSFDDVTATGPAIDPARRLPALRERRRFRRLPRRAEVADVGFHRFSLHVCLRPI